MIFSNAQFILLDVEGTTSSVAYVTEVLFPYARRELNIFLRENWARPDVAAAREQIARDAGGESLEAWAGGHGLPPEYILSLLRTHVLRLMDEDAKTTGLKALQGLIWEAGYRAGKLHSHVYPDVPPALEAWRAAGKRLAVYSSGSVLAQKLFFAHTVAGDLTPLFSAHFDTTTGPKKEASSYEKIARQLEVQPSDVLFLSDVAAELEAAEAAGMQVGLVVRDGQGTSQASASMPSIAQFGEVALRQGQ